MLYASSTCKPIVFLENTPVAYKYWIDFDSFDMIIYHFDSI